MLNTSLGISKLRGQWFEGPYNSLMMPIFHPSYLLRNESHAQGSPKWLMWQDIKEVKRVYDSL
jgi:DNA polymerase